jgi:hypothetical protein
MRMLSLIASIAVSGIALAGETQQPIAPGMVYFQGPGYYVVEVDLDSNATEVRVTQPHASDIDDMVTVAAHALEEGATVALNANYFGGSLNHPCGAARSSGTNYSDAYREVGNCETTLGWTPGLGKGAQAAVVNTLNHEDDAAFLPQLTEMVTAGNYLIKNGQPKCAPDDMHCDWGPKLEVGRDCSAVGVSSDRKRFIFIATNSATKTAPSVCSGFFLQSEFLLHNAADAIFLDGGGSTKLWIRGMGYVNNESADRFPPVVVYARPNGTCPSDCGANKCLQLDKPYRAQCAAQACRAGLNSTWTCDRHKRLRARCGADGRVEYQTCARGCAVADEGDDQCVGGVVTPSSR